MGRVVRGIAERVGHPATAPEAGRAPPTSRLIVKRALSAVLFGVVIYVLAPVLIKVAAAWPHLSSLRPGWAIFGIVAEAASFWCTFVLKRIALRTDAIFAVATSALVGNAVTNVFPGADATGATVEFRMLSSAGIETGDAISGLTVTALLQTGSLLGLPLLTLPAILAGAPITAGLAHLAYLGIGIFALYFVAVFVLLKTKEPLRVIGRVAERLRNRLFRRRRPLSGLSERLIRQRDSTLTALGRQWWQALLFTVGRVAFDFGCLLSMLAATRAGPVPWLVLIAYASTSLLALLPITPGGLGIVEGSLTGLLVLAGIPAAKAVLSTLAYRLASYWLPTLAGPLAFAAYRRHYRPSRAGGAESEVSGGRLEGPAA